jgi:hypothetical protein
MLDWFARLVLVVSGFFASWFIARDSANFGIVQLAFSLFLVTTCVIVAVFWRNILALFKSDKSREK